jgi:hypothetical protein
MEAFRQRIITADKHTRHRNIDQNTLRVLSIVPQHAFVATIKPPPLPQNIILRSHDSLPSPRMKSGLDDMQTYVHFLQAETGISYCRHGKMYNKKQ